MYKPLTRISIVLLLIVATPLVLYFIKQASSLSDNEEILQEVFENQIETVLFSINQNAENIIVSWVNQVDANEDCNSEMVSTVVNHLLQTNHSIREISFYSTDKRRKLGEYLADGSTGLYPPDNRILNRLQNYIKQNYQRVESVRNGKYVYFYVLLKVGGGKCFAAFAVEIDTFIEENLGTGIQQISQGLFNISISDTLNRNIELAGDSIMEKSKTVHSEALWYIPNHIIAIQLQTATISELVNERNKRDIYIFYGLIIIVILGITFILFSVRKEIKLAQLKAEFVSNVSHEIRTPLALISMYAETLLLKRFKTQAKSDEYLEIIQLETNRLTSIVNRILSFSKIEKDKVAYNYSNVAINEVVEGVVDVFSPQLKAGNVVCKLMLSDASTEVFADKEAVTEALMNLLDNAIKYSSGEAIRIDLRTFVNNRAVIVEVEDNGIGISRKEIKYIFDKFYRVTKGNLALKAKGSGLGLNIVKQIMKSHGGKVNVQSVVNEGSMFSLVFPIKAKNK